MVTFDKTLKEKFLTGSAALKNGSAFSNYNILTIRERNLFRLVQCIYKKAQKNCNTVFFCQIEYFWTKKQIRPKFANGNPNSLGLTLRSIWPHKIIIENYVVRSIKYFESTDLCWIFTRLRNHVWMIIKCWVCMGGFLTYY